jgi:TonB family protein
MKYVLMLITGLSLSVAQAQNVASTTHPEDSNTIICVFPIEHMPEFPGGRDAMLKYLSQNIRLPEEVISGQVKGRVYVNFLIDEQGHVRDAVIVKGLSKACDEEALRLISEMPDWIPGKQNGKAVVVKYTLPVVFDRKAK